MGDGRVGGCDGVLVNMGNQSPGKCHVFRRRRRIYPRHINQVGLYHAHKHRQVTQPAGLGWVRVEVRTNYGLIPTRWIRQWTSMDSGPVSEQS